MALNIGDALLKLSVDTTELEKGLKNVEKRCTDLGKKLMLVGGAITGALIGATIASAKLGEEIYNMSKRTGIGTVALSELRYMAKVSGTSLEGLEVQIRRMQQVLTEASDGTAEFVRKLKELDEATEQSQKDADTWLERELEDLRIWTDRELAVAGSNAEERLAILETASEKEEDIRRNYARRIEDIEKDKANALVEYSTESMRAINKLGLSIEQLQSLNAEDQFYMIASAIASIEDPTVRAAMAQEIFGRSGTMLLPIFADGAAGIAKMREEFHKYGRVVDEEAAANSVKFNKALTNLKESLGGVMDAIAKDLMPMLTKLLEDKIVPLINRIADWIGNNKELAKGLLIIGGTLAVGGAVLLGLGALARAIVALNAAAIILQALLGPAGWAKIIAGMALAGAAILGMKLLMESLGTEESSYPAYSTPALPAGGGYVPAELPPETSGETQQYKLGPYGPVPIETPEMQYGGTVPGPKGRPVPIIAHGGEEFLGVQNIGRTQGNMTMNVGLLPGDDVTLRKLARVFKDILGEDTRRTSFGQVNRGYFYGRSST